MKRPFETFFPRRIARFREVIARRQRDLTVVIENVHDPHNVSAVLRSADGVGIHRLHLLYTIESFPTLGKKSSSSAKKWIEIEHHRSVGECYAALRKEGFRIYASHVSQSSISLYDIDATMPSAFVFGNEHRGVSDEAVALADEVFSIPMMGMVESLNISVACAVTLYEALRQRLRKGMYDIPGFSEEEMNSMLLDWLQR
ncbi:MAG: RNA methyltransferase [Chlorobi bacterium]|nr:RNA methyltransferase [Chlorobiota bacterium]